MNSTKTQNVFEEACSIFNRFKAFNFTIVSVASSKVFVNHITVCVIVTALSISTTCLNSITAIAYWKSTELKKKMTHFLILVLSLNDLAVGIICCPLIVATFARELLLGKFSCFLSGILFFSRHITCGCSLRTLLMMNLERYLAIVHPIFHRTKVTKERLVKCLIILWLFVLAESIFSFYCPEVFSKVFSLGLSLSMAALIFIYVRIYFSSTRSSINFGRKNGTNASSNNQDTFETERRDYLRNLRLLKSCLIVVVCFGICFLPRAFLISNLLEINEDLFMIQVWSLILLVSNSSLNSLIFFWRNRLLRKEAQKILKQFLC